MSPSFLTSVLALVGPGWAGTAQLEEKGQLEEAANASDRLAVPVSPWGVGKLWPRGVPSPELEARMGGSCPPHVSPQRTPAAGTSRTRPGWG